ncbi:MAG: hypothetical protein J7K02_08570 [Deltaproteobacteria bacterium]|nr:hypothetical protein [Deltaproteobacteria bacterium]
MVNYTAFLALRRLRGIMCVELYNEKKGKQQGNNKKGELVMDITEKATEKTQ